MYLTEFISKKSSRIECEPKFESQFDVVVVGMGTAGAIAAIAAAEQGVTVCAVEKLNLPGGTATSGGIAGYYYGLPGGRFEELDNRARTTAEPGLSPGRRLPRRRQGNRARTGV